MEEPQKPAAEAEPQGQGRLGLERERGVVQLQLFQRPLEVQVILVVHRIEAREDHGTDLAESRQGPLRWAVRLGDGVPHPAQPDVPDAGNDVAHFPCAEPLHRPHAWREDPHLPHLEEVSARHQANPHPGRHASVVQPDVDDHPLVAVEPGVEDQRLEGGRRISLRRRDPGHDRLQDLVDSLPVLGAHQESLGAVQSQDVLDLGPHPGRVSAWEVDLVDHRHDGKVGPHRQVDVGQGLGLHSLDRVHDQNGPVAGREAPRHLVGEVDMARRIDQVEHVLLPVGRPVCQANRLGLDGDPPLPLQVHAVQHLLRHLPGGERPRPLQQAIRQCGFAVVDVSDDGEVADMVHRHAQPGSTFKVPGSPFKVQGSVGPSPTYGLLTAEPPGFSPRTRSIALFPKP